jgi:hypothetical protein
VKPPYELGARGKVSPDLRARQRGALEHAQSANMPSRPNTGHKQNETALALSARHFMTRCRRTVGQALQDGDLGEVKWKRSLAESTSFYQLRQATRFSCLARSVARKNAGKKMAEEPLEDAALVVRGGQNTSEIIRLSTFALPNGERAIAAVCGNSIELINLCAYVPHPFIGTSNVGAIRNSGGDVVATRGRGPFAAVIIMRTTADADQSDVNAIERPQAHADAIELFADFHNATPSGRVRLNTVGAFRDLQRLGIDLKPNMCVVLDDHDTLVADGVVVWEEGEGWVAEVDWNKIEEQLQHVNRGPTTV